MKGGQTPIHIQRWAAADYHADEHVKLLKARHDYRALTFYRHFLDQSFMSGGDLPANPEALAAVLEMPKRDVEKALAFCLGRLVFLEGDRLYQRRVKRDVIDELAFRGAQSARGKLGGRPKKKPTAFHKEATALIEDNPSKSPPSPAPAPAPDNGTHPPNPPPPEGAGGRVLHTAGNGFDPNSDTASALRYEDARRYAIDIGFRPGRRENRQLREWARAGHSLGQMQEVLDRLMADGESIVPPKRSRP